MPRVRIVEEREEATPDQLEVFDHIAASRGKMIRPFAAMIHRPELARAAADLGAVIRFRGALSDRDRELVICATAVERDCAFEWESHRPLALAAGVTEETLSSLVSGEPVSDPGGAVLVEFVGEACRGRVSEEVFAAARDRLGEEGVVELAVVVGYYNMLATFMNAVEAC